MLIDFKNSFYHKKIPPPFKCVATLPCKMFVL